VWLIYLAFALERVGDEFLERGALPDALKNYQQDLSVAVALYAQNPRSANYLSAVVQAHQRLGDYWMAKGDLPNAITEYKTYVDEATTLKNEDLSNFRFVEIAYVAHQRLGDAYLQQKNYSGAAGEFNSYRTDVEAYLNSTTANAASNNNAALYDQANAYQKIGDVALASGDLNGALTAYRRSQAVAFQLRDKNCNNGAWQKLVSMSYQRIGNVLKAQNNTALALSQFKSCAAIKVSPTVWSPQALTPRDIDQDCNQEVAQLVGAH
jgi:tetratricopeptide (TPR) repeat protein